MNSAWGGLASGSAANHPDSIFHPDIWQRSPGGQTLRVGTSLGRKRFSFFFVTLALDQISYIRKRKDPAGSGLISNNESAPISIHFLLFIRRGSTLSQNQGTIPTLLLNRKERNKERQSFLCQHLIVFKWIHSRKI